MPAPPDNFRRGPRVGSRSSSRGGFRDVPDEISMDISNMLAIYELVREEEKERDEILDQIQINFELVDKCIEAEGKSQEEIRKTISLVDISDIIKIVRKTPQSRGDKFLYYFTNLIYEYYDDVIYPQLIKKYYLLFIVTYINRVDIDSKLRAEFLLLFRNIARKIGGDIQKATKDIEAYGKSKIRNNAFSRLGSVFGKRENAEVEEEKDKDKSETFKILAELEDEEDFDEFE